MLAMAKLLPMSTHLYSLLFAAAASQLAKTSCADLIGV